MTPSEDRRKQERRNHQHEHYWWCPTCDIVIYQPPERYFDPRCSKCGVANWQTTDRRRPSGDAPASEKRCDCPGRRFPQHLPNCPKYGTTPASGTETHRFRLGAEWRHASGGNESTPALPDTPAAPPSFKCMRCGCEQTTKAGDKCKYCREPISAAPPSEGRERELEMAIADLLINNACSCGGQICPRCEMAIADAEALLSSDLLEQVPVRKARASAPLSAETPQDNAKTEKE